MRRKHIYGILFFVLAFFAVCSVKKPFGSEKVVESDAGGYWQPEWYPMISDTVNREGIKLEIDGTAVPFPRTKMSETGHFLIPVRLLPDEFSCAAFWKEDSCLLLERGKNMAELREGSRELSVKRRSAEEESIILLEDTVRWLDGELYVPLGALEQAFSFTSQWKPEENRLLVDSRETESYLPDSYDYREEGRAPEVKNQGNLGTCWAFASMMALESSLLPEKKVSFSEDHMSLQNSFHLGQNDGGEYTMSMAYLLAWQGPVYEEQDPYGDGYSPSGLSPVCHVQEIQVLPEKDYEAIKRAVFLYGGVQSSLYTSMVTGQEDAMYYKKENGAYCYRGTARPNHDVVIIGWDDTYPKENFVQMPEEDGAFICSNSWGGEFGESGYFYVSYYDTNIGIHNILYSGIEPADNYESVYQSDLCGWVGQLGYGKDNAYFANVYTAQSEEELSAVGFYATGADTSYEVYTVTDVEGSAQFGRRRLAASGVLTNAGFYTIPLKNPVELSEGEKFAVIVRITTPGSVHPVAIEYNSPDKDISADLSDGEGYISFRGTSWERVEEKQKCNVCLKAYTRRRPDEIRKQEG